MVDDESLSLSLFVTHPTGERTEHLLADGLKVGRLPEADVRVMSPHLSRVHFIIRRRDGGFIVESQHRVTASGSGMGRVLGTYLNGERVPGSRPLEAGDRISPIPDAQPGELVFTVGPTQRPTPAEEMPRPSGGLGIKAVLIVLVLLMLVGSLVAIVGALWVLLSLG